MGLERQRLLAAAQGFCDAFKDMADIDDILLFFASSDDSSVIEYGEPALAPFLGRRFIGAPGIRMYFETVQAVLSYGNLQFSDFVVDVETKKVGLKGSGTFQWKSTGESWDESFAYILSFDDGCRITEYQVWADSGSAYLARIGKLNEVRVRNQIFRSLGGVLIRTDSGQRLCDFQKRGKSRCDSYMAMSRCSQ